MLVSNTHLLRWPEAAGLLKLASRRGAPRACVRRILFSPTWVSCLNQGCATAAGPVLRLPAPAARPTRSSVRGRRHLRRYPISTAPRPAALRETLYLSRQPASRVAAAL